MTAIHTPASTNKVFAIKSEPHSGLFDIHSIADLLAWINAESQRLIDFTEELF